MNLKSKHFSLFNICSFYFFQSSKTPCGEKRKTSTTKASTREYEAHGTYLPVHTLMLLSFSFFFIFWGLVGFCFVGFFFSFLFSTQTIWSWITLYPEWPNWIQLLLMSHKHQLNSYSLLNSFLGTFQYKNISFTHKLVWLKTRSWKVHLKKTFLVFHPLSWKFFPQKWDLGGKKTFCLAERFDPQVESKLKHWTS